MKQLKTLTPLFLQRELYRAFVADDIRAFWQYTIQQRQEQLRTKSSC